MAIDVRRTPSGYEVHSHSATRPTGRDPVAWAREAEARGAGEILLTSVERDGAMCGYDTELIGQVARAVRIPVIASGGASCAADFVAAVRDGGASSVAAGAIFQFTETTPREVREALREAGLPVRRT